MDLPTLKRGSKGSHSLNHPRDMQDGTLGIFFSFCILCSAVLLAVAPSTTVFSNSTRDKTPTFSTLPPSYYSCCRVGWMGGVFRLHVTTKLLASPTKSKRNGCTGYMANLGQVYEYQLEESIKIIIQISPSVSGARSLAGSLESRWVP